MLRLHNANYLSDSGIIKYGTITCNGDRLKITPQPEAIAKQNKFQPFASLSVSHQTGDFDLAGRLVLPGIIDTHTHLREPGQTYKEGIINGTKAALRGGVTSVLDMPNNNPPITTTSRLMDKRALFYKKALCNWGLFLQASKKTELVHKQQYVAVKIYMAKSSSQKPILDLEDVIRLMEHYPILTVHAEAETAFTDNFLQQPPQGQYGLTHHLRRPKQAVTSALALLEQALQSIPQKKQPRIVIAHANTSEEVAWVSRMKHEGYDVWAETSPHYLLLTSKHYQQIGQALKVNPPLRSNKDTAAIKQGISDGIIDFFGSDHAPHTLEEKQDKKNPPSGIPGIEWMMPIALHLVKKQILSWKQFTKFICKNATSCYKLQDRPGIKNNAPADMVIMEDGTDPWGSEVITKANFHPYKTMKFPSYVHTTIVNGKVQYCNKKFGTSCGKELINE